MEPENNCAVKPKLLDLCPSIQKVKINFKLLKYIGWIETLSRLFPKYDLDNSSRQNKAKILKHICDFFIFLNSIFRTPVLELRWKLCLPGRRIRTCNSSCMYLKILIEDCFFILFRYFCPSWLRIRNWYFCVLLFKFYSTLKISFSFGFCIFFVIFYLFPVDFVTKIEDNRFKILSLYLYLE